LWVSREAAERTGAHPFPDLFGLIALSAETEAGGGSPLGALGYGGSFANVGLSASGRELRLPRMEGLDLSRLALDRLGPGLDLMPMGSAGEVAVTDRPELGPGSLQILTHPTETPGDSASSRFAGQTGGSDVGIASLFFADRRGRFSYSINVENGKSERTGALSEMHTRLSILDFGLRTGFGRLVLQLHNQESSAGYLNGLEPNHFDQGLRGGIVAGDSLGPAWSLLVRGLDDRLSGNELPGIELKRKELGVAAELHARPGRPYWARVDAERDWFAIRHPSGVFAPRVNRARGAAGLGLDLGGMGLSASANALASDRHRLRTGGFGEVSFPIPGRFVMGVGGGRGLVEPTFDQEVLVPGRPIAEPEQHDQGVLRITRQGLVAFGFRAARRNLVHVPFVDSMRLTNPWPEFTFDEVESRHWELAGSAESPLPWGFVAGIAANRLFELDQHGDRLPFVPEAVAHAHLVWHGELFGGDFVMLPRADLLWIGERKDFGGQAIADHMRLDLTMLAVVGQDFDLELRMRNVTDERYALAVIDPTSGEPFPDTGQLIVFALRWRFLN
jgi:hypothetical protein